MERLVLKIGGVCALSACCFTTVETDAFVDMMMVGSVGGWGSVLLVVVDAHADTRKHKRTGTPHKPMPTQERNSKNKKKNKP